MEKEEAFSLLDKVDRSIAGFMNKYGKLLLRLSLAIIFIWFGALKIFDMSPAERIVKATVYWLDEDKFFIILGYWEVLIGISLLFKSLLRFALLLLFLQMPGTLLPLFILPEACFTDFPFGLTTEGQYIIKNLVLISAALVIGGTVRYKDEKELV
jgi:uncharacterized membrane protein YkgB